MKSENNIAKQVDLYLSGQINAKELAELNTTLQSSPEARREFLELTKLECALYEQFSGNQPIILQSTLDRETPTRVQPAKRGKKIALVITSAAACVLLGFFIGRTEKQIANPDNQVEISNPLPKQPLPSQETSDGVNFEFGPVAGSGDLKSDQKEVWLDELGTAHFQQGFGTAQTNRSMGHGPLIVAGKKYHRGIGTHADSVAVYQLPPGVLKFEATVGLSDEVIGKVWKGKKAGCFFKVLGDGEVLWESGLMRAGDKARKFEVSLSQLQEMRLVVEAGPDDITFDHSNWMDARFHHTGQRPIAEAWTPDLSSFILTPKPGPQPQINGAKIIGGTPGKPFLFRIPTTGIRPIKFQAEGLPNTLTLDTDKGIISGIVPSIGTHPVILSAQNEHGKDRSTLRIVSGDTLSLTPPMGWNSWYCWSESVSAEKVERTARALVDKGLADHGWTYINIDDCWQGQRGGPLNAIQGNVRFKDMKGLCNEVHRHGLKIGIYSTPWISSYAGFIGGSSMDPSGHSPELHVAPKDRIQPSQVYGRYPNFNKLNLDHVGEYWFCDKDAQQWSEWGVDFVKYDWKPNDIPTTTRLQNDLQQSGRDIIFSLSNDTPFDNAEGISERANLWRTGGDIHDNWESILRNGFEKTQWIPFTRPGHWCDPDMLQIGMAGVPNNYVRKLKPSQLTPHEQFSQISLWSLLSAPLLLSCDVESMDAFTISLLNNAEVIAVNQDPLGKSAAPVNGNKEVWLKELEDGSYALGIFNLSNEKRTIKVSWEQLQLPQGSWQIRDLWRQKNLSIEEQSFSTQVESHGVTFVSLRKNS